MDLVRPGQPFFAAGVNCYFLAYCSGETRRGVLATAKSMGADTVRSWAFFPDPGPADLERLDDLIAAAEESDLRLILPFENYWDDFGGLSRYGPDKDVFYRDPAARDAYRGWAGTLLTRRNTRTLRLYCEEPAVLSWQLMNEPRAADPPLLLDWTAAMSAFVKSLDPNHLLSAGDEGDLDAMLDIPDLDFGTCHFYPGNRGLRAKHGERWIRERIEAGRRAGKPMLLAEYGLKSRRERCKWYPRWQSAVADAGGAGHLLWMLGSAEPDVAGFRDDYTIYDASL